MALTVKKVDVWAGDVADQPGGLAGVLEAIAGAGGDLEFVIARRQPDKPGSGVVFVTPVKGKKVQTAAGGVGLTQTANIATLRIEGPNKAGIGAKISRAIADAGVNVRGLSAAAIGNKFVSFIAFDSADDAGTAAKAVRGVK